MCANVKHCAGVLQCGVQCCCRARIKHSVGVLPMKSSVLIWCKCEIIHVGDSVVQI